MSLEKIKLPKSKVFLKLCSYCAYQERCLSEVELFLEKFEISTYDKDEMISDLVAQKFLDQIRYAKSVARGKFYSKSWGRLKIRFYLKGKKIEDFQINKALAEINSSDYLDRCTKLVQKQKEKLAPKELDTFTMNQKIISSLLQKGYEYAIINEVLI